MQRFEQTPRRIVVVVSAVVWRLEEARWVRCTSRWTQASEPTLVASSLSVERRAECARVESTCLDAFVFISQCD